MAAVGPLGGVNKNWIELIVRFISNLLFWLILCALVRWALPWFIAKVHGVVSSDLLNLGTLFDGRLLAAQFFAGTILILAYLWIGTAFKTGNVAEMAKSVAAEMFGITMNTGSLFIAAAVVDSVGSGGAIGYGIVAYFFSFALWLVI
jgi:voltage-gated potassium channel Kch